MSNGLITIDAFKGDDDFAEMSPQDRIISRLLLMQFGSKPVKNDQAKAGSWINSASMETVCTKEQTLKVIPLIYWKKWVEWNPVKGAPKGTGPGKMILNQTSNPADPIAIAANSNPRPKVLVEGREKPKYTEYYVYLCAAPAIFGDCNTLFTVEFCRSAHKVGKEWLNRQEQFKVEHPETKQKVRAPMGMVEWELGSKMEHDTRTDSDYFVPRVVGGKMVSPEILGQILTLKEAVKKQKDQLSRREVADAEEDGVKEAEVVSDPDLT